jgi:cell division protein ZapA (FtsZ GTPase activity inhibitor)
MSVGAPDVTKRTYPIRVLGRSITVQSTAEREDVEAVAGLVTERMEEARRRSRSTDVAEVAILTALNLAAEFLSLQKILNDERERLRLWADSMCGRLDEQVVG